MMSESKAELREAMARHRSGFGADAVLRESEQIQSVVTESAAFGDAGAIGCYLALPDEVQTTAIIAAAHEAGKPVAVPAFDSGLRAYRYCRLEPDGPVVDGPFRVPEPASPHWADDMQLDLAIVPGVAFDAMGGRLGHGKGYIDRLLRRHADLLGTTAGLAFDFQLVPTVPMHESDQRLDLVVTAAGVRGQTTSYQGDIQ